METVNCFDDVNWSAEFSCPSLSEVESGVDFFDPIAFWRLPPNSHLLFRRHRRHMVFRGTIVSSHESSDRLPQGSENTATVATGMTTSWPCARRCWMRLALGTMVAWNRRTEWSDLWLRLPRKIRALLQDWFHERRRPSRVRTRDSVAGEGRWTLKTALFYGAVLVAGSFTAVALLGLGVGWLRNPWRKW